jgi:hypothetical protein
MVNPKFPVTFVDQAALKAQVASATADCGIVNRGALRTRLGACG